MVEQAATVELKLIRDERHDEDPIPLERRIAHRKAVSGRVTALMTMKVNEDEVRNRICSLELINLSDTGVGAFSHEPLPLDAKITLFLPPHGPERGFDLYGSIVRCDANENGYSIGVRLDRQASACA